MFELWLSIFLLAGLVVLGLVLARLHRLDATIRALIERVTQMERLANRRDQLPQVQPERQFASSTTPIPDEQSLVSAAPPPIPAHLRYPKQSEAESRDADARPAAVPAVSPSETATPFNWEAFMGVKLFAWLGGFALFLGIVFLVKYSFENNLITPLARIAIGGLIALALVALGGWLARGRYRATAQSLCATGIVVLYADLFAAHSFYQLISLTSTFFAMAAVTLSSFLLAVALDAQVIVVLGLSGGFLTPVLLPSAVDNAPALFLYIALLDLGIAAVALRQRWLYLILLAAIGTASTEVGWAGKFFTHASGGRAFWVFLGFEALFLFFFFVTHWTKGSSFRRGLLPPASHWVTAPTALVGFTALGFGFWICAVPLLARQALFFLSFIFLADAGLLALPVLGRAHRAVAAGAAAMTFALVATWIGFYAPKVALNAALAAIVIFALLHAATTPASAWRPGFPPFTATGTVTPFILLIILFERLELPNPTSVFAVAFILSAILLAAAIVRQADWLSGAALLGIGLVELVWQNDRFTNENVAPALVWYGLFLVLFVAYPFCSAQKEKAWAWAISALAQGLQFWLFYRAITLALPNDRMGLLAAAFVLPAGIGVVALLRLYGAVPASGDVRLAWQGGALLLFVSLIFPLQFDREWITLGWALEGVALLWLFHRVPHRGLQLVGTLLLCAAFVRLALNPAVLEYHRRTGVRIWNWYLYVYGIATACLLSGAWLTRHRPAGISAPGDTRFTPALLGSLGVILGFILLNLEIADYFSIGPTLTFSFTGNFARDMTYSIAWALFALGLIVAGMRMEQRAARYAGVALLVVTLAKLFLHDLNDLAELYRIGAFVSVAMILIAASFIYQRFLAPERAAK